MLEEDILGAYIEEGESTGDGQLQGHLTATYAIQAAAYYDYYPH